MRLSEGMIDWNDRWPIYISSYFPEYLTESIVRSWKLNHSAWKNYSAEKRSLHLGWCARNVFDTVEDRSPRKGHDYQLIYYVKLSFLFLSFLPGLSRIVD